MYRPRKTEVNLINKLSRMARDWYGKPDPNLLYNDQQVSTLGEELGIAVARATYTYLSRTGPREPTKHQIRAW
jgi:hypothetical protein